MSYDGTETSAQSGSPVELYEFEVDGVTYRYTSGREVYNWNTKDYLPVTLQRGEIVDTGELPKNDLEITVPRDFPVSELFRVAPPANVVVARLIEVHRSDGAQEGITKWIGRVLTVDWKGVESTLYCENEYTSLKRPGLRRAYARQCPHVLYGSVGCRLVAADFEELATLTVVNGTELEATEFDAQPDGFFDGGYVEWERSPGIFDRRAIRSHVGAVITVTHSFSDLPVGTVVKAFPGCDHTFATCQAKFANTDNFGGFPNIPKQNPFGQSSVF